MNMHNCAHHANAIMTHWKSCVTEYIKIASGTLMRFCQLNNKQNIFKKNRYYKLSASQNKYIDLNRRFTR